MGWAASVRAQGTFAPLNPDYYHLVDRYEIRRGTLTRAFQTAVKPYERRGIALFADSLLADTTLTLSRADRFNLTYLQLDNFEWSENSGESRQPVLNKLYRQARDFYHYGDEHFDVHVNPVLYGQLGADSRAAARPFILSRGVELHGLINQKIGFYTFATDNAVRFPLYVSERVDAFNVVPQEGFWKFLDAQTNSYEFFTARGYMTANVTRNVGLQFGHDRLFIGNGYRSMILSDFANNYNFLRINTHVWRVHYTNLFTQMYADVPTTFPGQSRTLAASVEYPRKYMAFHRLGLDLGKNVNVGLFEAIVFGREDSLSRGQFDLKYLNPVMFYRALEQQSGSPDNALLGLDFKWNFLRRFQLYGQLVVDEFLYSNVVAADGWWGNKQAGQVGLHYVDAFGLSNLDVQAELNVARPYTYGHDDIYTSYAHYKMPLAHPLGANFREWVGLLRYQPLPRLQVLGKLIVAQYGADSAGSHWGSNVLISYDERERLPPGGNDRGHFIGQGVGTQLQMADLTLTYQVRHNLFAEVRQVGRRLTSDLPGRNQQTWFTSVALRWNIPRRVQAF